MVRDIDNNNKVEVTGILVISPVAGREFVLTVPDPDEVVLLDVLVVGLAVVVPEVVVRAVDPVVVLELVVVL